MKHARHESWCLCTECIGQWPGELFEPSYAFVHHQPETHALAGRHVAVDGRDGGSS